MILKFRDNTTFLFGKIKYSNKLVFDLDKIERYDFLREYIAEKLDLSAPTPYIEPPRKGTVLGHTKETIRFNDAHFISNIGNNLLKVLDSISFGFGEQGYYYDIYLINQEFEMEQFKAEMKDLTQLIYNLELRFENELKDFYYNEKIDNNNMEFAEISNFQATIEWDNFLINNFSLLNSIMRIIDNKSDIIAEEGLNFSQPELKIKLHNDTIFKSLDLFREIAKPLFNQRFFKIKKLLAKEELWSISSRGLPIESIINIIALFK